MSYVQLSEGGSRWFTPLACGPTSPELSKSASDMASKLLMFYIYICIQSGATVTPVQPKLA